jgi:beta-xylosidase
MVKNNLRTGFGWILAAAILGTAAGISTGTEETSGNPILPDFYADPTAREFEGRFWIYPSHDLPGSTYWDMVDWHVFSSDDLVRWHDHGVIFSLDDVSWADRWAWAPDCIARNGKYYFYFPADMQIGVAVGPSPTGPFSDALGRPLIGRGEAETTVIDPAVFIDDDGQAYLYFGNGNAESLRVVRLNEDMITRDGPILKVRAENFHEAAWMHKYEGRYYLSYCSLEGTGPEGELKSRIAYSIGESPLGPFEYQGWILDNGSRNNHHSIVKFGNQWYIFYHVQGPSWYERRVCAEFLEYDDNGSILPVKMTKTGIRLR